MLSVFGDINCNKRGQTPGIVTGTQIQKFCNTEENTCNCNLFVGFVHFDHGRLLLGSSHKVMMLFPRHICVSSHLSFRLYKNFRYSAA